MGKASLQEYQSHFKKTWSVSYPLVFGQMMQMSLMIVDNIMVGRVGSVNLAAVSFANSALALVLFFAIGISLGVTPLVGKANGAGDDFRIKVIFYNSFCFHIVFAILFVGGLILAAPLLGYLGQSAEVVELAKPYYRLMCLAFFPGLIFSHFKHFLDGLKITRPGAISLVFANIVNLILNYLLIYGKFGFPALGINGSGIATVLARVMQVVAIVFYFIYINRKLYETYWKAKRVRIFRSIILQIFKMGFPIALQMVAEIAYFALFGIIVGWFGSDSLSAHTIAMNVSSLTYLMAAGVGGGATIRISNFLGQKHYYKMRIAAYSASVMSFVFMSCCGILILIYRHQIPMLFLGDGDLPVQELAAKLLVISALYQVFDGSQITSLGILRGLHDVKVASMICFCAYWVVGFSASYILGVTYNLQAYGIWYGFVLSLVFSAVGLTYRYFYILKSIEKREGPKEGNGYQNAKIC